MIKEWFFFFLFILNIFANSCLLLKIQQTYFYLSFHCRAKSLTCSFSCLTSLHVHPGGPLIDLLIELLSACYGVLNIILKIIFMWIYEGFPLVYKLFVVNNNK